MIKPVDLGLPAKFTEFRENQLELSAKNNTAVDLEKRMVEMVARTQPQPPDGWVKKFVIHPNETPWWELENREERYRAYCRQWARMWDQLHPGVDAETLRRYHKRHPEENARRMKLRREEHPEYAVEAIKRFRKKHPRYFAEAHVRYKREHPEACAESIRRFFKTPKGKAALAKHEAKRRERSTNPTIFAARILQLHANKEPCAECGASYSKTHQVDHMLALCLGGTDDWDNLQPLCIICHRKKTAEDVVKYRNVVFPSPACIGMEFDNLRNIVSRNKKVC